MFFAAKRREEVSEADGDKTSTPTIAGQGDGRASFHQERPLWMRYKGNGGGSKEVSIEIDGRLVPPLQDRSWL